jgi:hypothetical protein
MLPEIQLFLSEHWFLLIVGLILLTIAIVKIVHPFWNLQPVYHTYDIWRWIYWSPFVFYKRAPIKTKFCDDTKVRTKAYVDVTDEEMAEWVELVQAHYLPTERIFCTADKQYLNAHMVGSLEPSYLSFYRTVVPINLLPYRIKPIGCIVSRPIRIWFHGKDPLIAYYWDFVCIDRNEVKRGISRQLIQTAEYNQRQKNPSVAISVFKKEVVLCPGVVPFTQFKTRTYYLHMRTPPKLTKGYNCIRVHRKNAHLLQESLAEISTKFEICMYPDIAHLIGLVESNILYIYVLQEKDAIAAIYFFKDLQLHYDDIEPINPVQKNTDELGNSIHCLASVQNVETPIFYLGFVYSLYLLLKHQPKYRVLLMEEVADNRTLLTAWQKEPIFETDTAYYFFNYFYPRTHSPENVFLLS